MASVHASATPTAPSECPRCGYDLRGVVAAWRDSCPVAGCCGECGLAFAWSQVLGPDATPRWFVESRRRHRFSGVRTLSRSLLPWRFWRRIQMTMPVQRSLWTYPLRLAALVLMIGTLATAARALITAPGLQNSDPVAVAVTVALASACPFLTEPVDQIMERWVPGWSMGGPVTPGPRLPWGWNRGGSAVPSEIAGATWKSVRPIAHWTIVALACSVATFMVLPIVRRRAKVRWVHIHRAAIYGLAMVPVMSILCWTLDASWLVRLDARTRLFYTDEARSLPWEIALIPALLALWWWSVSRWYLRLERPLAVALSVTMVGFVACMALHYLLTGRELIRWLIHAPWI